MMTQPYQTSAVLSLYGHIHMDKQIINAIAQAPAQYGLTPHGLTHNLLQYHIDKVDENEIIAALKNLTLKSEKDKTYGYTPLHWCAVLNYPRAASYLISRGICSNKNSNNAGFLPSQLAAFYGNVAFLESYLAKTCELNSVSIECDTPKGKITCELNELHWAMLGGHLEMVQAIFNTLTTNHKLINPEIKGIGNLLHLIVYAGLLEEKLAPERRVSNDLLYLVLRHPYTGKTIAGLLIESASNHENCTPLMLIAKKGQVDKIKPFIDHMRYQLEESANLEQIREAFYLAATEGQVEMVRVLLNYYHFAPQASHKQYNNCIVELSKKKDDNPDLETIDNLIHGCLEGINVSQFNPPKPQEQAYENLVLAGGGGKGLVYPYALKHFKALCKNRQQQAELLPEQKDALGFNCIKRIAGTSAGSIFALGLAIGYEPEELEKYLDTDYAEFLENAEVDALLQQVDSGKGNNQDIIKNALKALNLKIKNLIQAYQNVAQNHYSLLSVTYESIKNLSEIKQAVADVLKLNQAFRGFSTGQKALTFLQQLLIDKGLNAEITFGELAERIKQDKLNKYKHLYVVVTNLTRGTFEVLSTENPDYKNYLVVDAVRASMSYPVIFVPHQLKEKKPQEIVTLPDEYVDGGVLRNYAIDEFDLKKYTPHHDAMGDPRYPVFNPATIGFRFIHEEPVQDVKAADSIMGELMCFSHLYMKAEVLISKHLDREYHRSIVIDTGKISTFSFKKLGNVEKQLLKAAGEEAVNAFFEQKKPSHVKSPHIMFSSAQPYSSALPPAVNNLADGNIQEQKKEPFGNF